jgi:hypothetical protein
MTVPVGESPPTCEEIVTAVPTSARSGVAEIVVVDDALVTV